jgi:hypothetical protein
MSPREQATGFVEHNGRLVAAYEALTADQRESLRVDLGFLPEPLPWPRGGHAAQRVDAALLGRAGGARRGRGRPRGRGPAAAGTPGGRSRLHDGFTGKADALAKPATVQVSGGRVGLVIADKVSVTTAVDQPDRDVRRTARRRAPAHRWQALPGAHAPGVEVIGDVTLDDLRAVFPGYSPPARTGDRLGGQAEQQPLLSHLDVEETPGGSGAVAR